MEVHKNMEKKLTRSTDKMVSGVAGGIANYIGIDPVIVRLVVALLILSHPPLGIIIYVLMAIIMPEAGDAVKASANPFSEEEIIVKDA